MNYGIKYPMRYPVEEIMKDSKSGMSYRNMNKKYNISINTLRKIIHDSMDRQKEVSVADEIYSLATRNEGILESEEYQIISSYLSVWDNEVKKKIRRQCRERALREGNRCLFVPDWIGRETPRGNRDLMMGLANELNQRIHESISSFIEETGYANHKVIHFVLCQLAVNGFSPASISDICDRYDNIVCALEESGDK